MTDDKVMKQKDFYLKYELCDTEKVTFYKWKLTFLPNVREGRSRK